MAVGLKFSTRRLQLSRCGYFFPKCTTNFLRFCVVFANKSATSSNFSRSLTQYSLPSTFDIIHLRLNDVRRWPLYDGSLCHNKYKNFINNDLFDKCNDICQFRQAPIDNNVLINLINEAKNKYPQHEIIIITSPGEHVSTPFRCISNSNPDIDLFLLCNTEVLITSKSTFGIMPLFFGIVKEAWVPLWCHNTCLGMDTKYDNIDKDNIIINYY